MQKFRRKSFFAWEKFCRLDLPEPCVDGSYCKKNNDKGLILINERLFNFIVLSEKHILQECSFELYADYTRNITDVKWMEKFQAILQQANINSALKVSVLVGLMWICSFISAIRWDKLADADRTFQISTYSIARSSMLHLVWSDEGSETFFRVFSSGGLRKSKLIVLFSFVSRVNRFASATPPSEFSAASTNVSPFSFVYSLTECKLRYYLSNFPIYKYYSAQVAHQL